RVESDVDHHRVHDRDRGRRPRYTRQPARLDAPAQPPARSRRATEKRREKTDQTYCGRFLPFAPENLGIQFRAGEEGEHDGAGTGEELDPGLIRSQERGTEGSAEDELRHRADQDLGERIGYLDPDREQRREQRKPEPERGQSPDFRHRLLRRRSTSAAPSAARLRRRKPALRPSARPEESPPSSKTARGS